MRDKIILILEVIGWIIALVVVAISTSIIGIRRTVPGLPGSALLYRRSPEFPAAVAFKDARAHIHQGNQY